VHRPSLEHRFCVCITTAESNECAVYMQVPTNVSFGLMTAFFPMVSSDTRACTSQPPMGCVTEMRIVLLAVLITLDCFTQLLCSTGHDLGSEALPGRAVDRMAVRAHGHLRGGAGVCLRTTSTEAEGESSTLLLVPPSRYLNNVHYFLVETADQSCVYRSRWPRPRNCHRCT
jgi:hypothetical protein